MQNKLLTWILLPGLLVAATGCPNVKTDPGEGPNDAVKSGPIVEFDPANSIIPFPNNLVLDPVTGHVNLPAQCGETPTALATRVGMLNKLDGFGTYQAGMRVTFTAPVDPASLTGKIVLYKRGADLNAATAVPVAVIPGTTTRFDASCANPKSVDSITIVPLAPLEQKSFYTVALLAGIKSASGDEFSPSFTWSLIRQEEEPVTLDAYGDVVTNRTPLNPTKPEQLVQLRGIDRLWKAHNESLKFLALKQHARNDILVAWEFRTQTVTDALDPTVPGSPASAVSKTPLLGMQSLTCDYDATLCPKGIVRAAPPYDVCPTTGPFADNNVQCYLKIALGAGVYAVGDAICALVGCAAVGDVVAGALASKSYQVDMPNAYDATKPIPGAWGDPIKPEKVKTNLIGVLGFIPIGAAPGAGHKTVVFGHGLGSNKSSLFAIGPQLAANGYASVAIDFVAHDTRAVRISSDPLKGCSAPTPGTAPQCYAPFLSADLAGTRDNIRQTVLDLQGLVEGLKACGTTMCNAIVPNFKINPAKIGYAGISIGGIIGSTLAATMPDVKAAVLNVPGVGFGDIIENTATKEIKCPLIDALIDAGVVTGDKWDPTPSPDTGICVGDEWKAQASYKSFAAIIRWVLDPADPANFTSKLATRKFLIQEVVGDLVVPNISTDYEGALVGLTAGTADAATSSPPPPSAAITTLPTASKFVKYPTLPAAGPFPGNTFTHSSLLLPSTGTAGQLGTARLQTDAITFLSINNP